MEFDDLVKLYEKMKEKYGIEAYRHISELLRNAKSVHKEGFANSATATRAKAEGRIPDHEQSWRSFKGRNLEKLVMRMIEDEVSALGLKVVDGNFLERKKFENLAKELSQVKRNLLVDYGEFGAHLPDVDLIIYDPKTENNKILAVISSKVTLRERIAQTGYWKIKLQSDEVTKGIKVFFITPDEDGTLTLRKPAKKGRAIVEVDTDGGYVMTEAEIDESDKVKKFDRFITDLKQLLKENKKKS